MKEPFSRRLQWVLVAPAVVFAAFLVLAGLNAPNRWTTGLLVIAAVVAGLVELIAVPRAVFLLARDGRHRSIRNVAMTLLGAVPLLLVAAVVGQGIYR